MVKHMVKLGALSWVASSFYEFQPKQNANNFFY